MGTSANVSSKAWLPKCMVIGLAVIFIQGCQEPPLGKSYSFTADREIAEVKTGHENGGIGLAAADYDQDGDIDLITVRHLDKGKILLYANDGEGNYTESGQIGQVKCGFYGIGLAAADFDGDGDVDLAILKYKDGGRVVLYKNDGSGLLYE